MSARHAWRPFNTGISVYCGSASLCRPSAPRCSLLPSTGTSTNHSRATPTPQIFWGLNLTWGRRPGFGYFRLDDQRKYDLFYGRSPIRGSRSRAGGGGFWGVLCYRYRGASHGSADGLGGLEISPPAELHHSISRGLIQQFGQGGCGLLGIEPNHAGLVPAFKNYSQ